MKTVFRMLIVVLMLAAVYPLSLVNAQDGGDFNAAPVASGAYYLEAEAGTFEAVEGDTYTLSLEGVGPEIIWIMTAPALSVNALNTVNFNNNWSAADALTTNAVLKVGDLAVEMVVGSPAYDEENDVQSYEVTVMNIISATDEKDPELPMEFDAAALSLGWSSDFQQGLLQGVVALFEDFRATPAQCRDAQDVMTNYFNTIVPPLNAAIQENVSLCYSTGDPAACTLYLQLTVQLQNEWKQVEPYAVMLQNECTHIAGEPQGQGQGNN